jgi:hypothetical protein
MKRLVLCLAAAISFVTPLSFAVDHDPPPVAPATAFPAVDIHTDEQVAIAAEPYETNEKQSLFRMNYLKAGFLPIRMIVTNNGDKPISLKDARIHFITATGDKIPAAEPEDIERRTTEVSQTGQRIPSPSPIPLHRKPKSKEKDIEADFASFEYQAIVVEPHTTRAGFLFYDVQGLANPLMGAKLYLRMVRGSDGHELFYFEVPFDKYLSSKSKPTL